MSHIERNGLPSEYTQTLVGSVGAKERLRRSQKIACIVWQGMRLTLLSWSLLCLYCALKSSLGSRADVSAVLFNLCFGVVAWWLACRTWATPEVHERR